MPRRVSATEAKNRLGSIIDWVLQNKDEVVIESRGTPTVVIMSMDEYESVGALRERARRADALQQMRQLRERVVARNRDLSPEQGDALADRFSREVIEEMAEEGRIRFAE